jgi:hypothetical protein
MDSLELRAVASGGYAYADPERHFAIAFLKNSIGPAPAGRPAASQAVYAAVADEHR